VLVIISTIVVALVLLLASGVDATADVTANTESYVVRSGDTIWDIAAERTPDGFDVRDTVAAIQAMNRLSRATIHPGQTLEVPLD
jgi:Tfp pilus assembly protein FimV